MQRTCRAPILHARNLFYFESRSLHLIVANGLFSCHTHTICLKLIATLLILLLAWPLQAQESLGGSEGLQARAVTILEARCVRCHGDSRSESQLRLDRSDLLKKKGRAGNPILGAEEESELIRRIVSADPSYRMPKGEPPLPADEIELLKSWIRSSEGLPAFDASKSDASVVAKLDKHDQSFWERNSSTIDKIEDFNRPIQVLYLPALVFFVLALLLERRKRVLVGTAFDSARLSSLDRFIARLHWSNYLYVGIGFVLLGYVLHFRDRFEKVEARLREVQVENERLIHEHSPKEADNRLKAIRPKHPPRLGGTYYRGNDERNPQLFNGGYYRTATFEVALVDVQGKKLEWGDDVPSDYLLIKLDVKRAPFASPQLFSDDAMQNCFITRNATSAIVDASERVDTDDLSHSSELVRLTTVVPNEHWTGSYRIIDLKDKRADYDGKLFLTPGTPPTHYGIEYKIKIVDGKISEESEIWMGSIYNSGVVMLPNPDRIQLSEWFDFLPIPEITRANSTDPALIGIKPKD